MPAVTCPAPLLCGLDALCCPRPSTCAVSGDRVPPAEETKREAHTATLIAQETIRPLTRLPRSRWPLCRQSFVAARPVRPDHDTFVRPRRSRPFAHVLSLLKNDASLIRRRDWLARLGVCSGDRVGPPLGPCPGASRSKAAEGGGRQGCQNCGFNRGRISGGGPDAMPKRGRGRHPTTWRGVAVSVVDRHLQTMASARQRPCLRIRPSRRARGPSQDGNGMAHPIPSTITSVSPSCPRLAPPKEPPRTDKNVPFAHCHYEVPTQEMRRAKCKRKVLPAWRKFLAGWLRLERGEAAGGSYGGLGRCQHTDKIAPRSCTEHVRHSASSTSQSRKEGTCPLPQRVSRFTFSPLARACSRAAVPVSCARGLEASTIVL